MHLFKGYTDCLCIHYYILATHTECWPFLSIVHSAQYAHITCLELACHNTMVSKGPCRCLCTHHLHCYMPYIYLTNYGYATVVHSLSVAMELHSTPSAYIVSLLNSMPQCLWAVSKIKISRSTAVQPIQTRYGGINKIWLTWRRDWQRELWLKLLREGGGGGDGGDDV